MAPLPPGVTLTDGRGGLQKLAIATEAASAELFLHGAHLTHWQPRGHDPVLFLSEKSLYDPTKPIRGGIPVIFPWFGPHPTRTDLPIHGTVRTKPWTLESASPDGTVRLALDTDEAGLSMAFSIGASLEVRMTVRARKALTFEEALHTYFAVGDVRRVSVTGLENTDYIDKVDGRKRKTQSDEPVRIGAETDRVYLGTTKTCVIRDPVLKRRIEVAKEGSGTTVVWNPWIDKARAMADFGDDEWPKMICVESANAGEAALALEPGQSHTLVVRITVSKENLS